MDCRLERQHKYLFFFLTCMGVLYVLPLMLTDRYYNDDLARALYGATGWEGDGRPLAEWLMNTLCGGELTDISPLPLLLSILILSWSMVIYAKANLEWSAGWIPMGMALLMVFVNPLVMENLSYQYDCVFMFLAVSLSFLLFSLKRSLHALWYFVISAITVTAIMSLYQAALGMFVVLLVIHAFLQIRMYDYREMLPKDAARILGAGGGVFYYVYELSGKYVDQDGWRAEAARVSIRPNRETLYNVLENIENSCMYIYEYLCKTARLYRMSLKLLLIVTLLALLFFGWKNRKEKGTFRYLLAAVVALPCAFLGVFLPMTVLSSNNIKTRVFLCFGGVLLLLSMILLQTIPKQKCVIVATLGMCLFFQYTCMYAYGNALDCQQEYEKYMVYSLTHDLEILDADGTFQTVSFVGETPRAPQLQTMCEKYPLFTDMVPVYLNNSTWIGGAWAYRYQQNRLVLVEPDAEDEAVLTEQTPVLDNALYACYLKGDKIIVRWK